MSERQRFRLSSSVLAVLVGGLLGIALSGCGGAQSRGARHLDRGNRYLAANNLEKARVEFRNALQITPTDATARYDNGVVEERLQNLVEAAGFYKAAIDADPDHVPARVALAKLMLIAGFPERSLETIKPGFTRHPEDARLLSLRAACESALKNPDAALTDAEHAVRLDPKNVDAVAVLAGLYRARGETDRTRALLESTLKQVPDNVDLRLLLVYAYRSLNLEPQAEAMLIELIKLRPSEPAQRIRMAQYYIGMKRSDAAEAALRAGIKAIPDDPGLKGALLDFLASTRGRTIAEQELAALIAADPSDSSLRFEAARFHEEGKEYGQAEREYREIIARSKLEGPGLTARNRLASLKVMQNDLSGARELVDEVLASAPRDDDALILRGNLALRENKDPKAAIADLRAVLRDQPNAIGVMRSLARAHVANGEPDLAAEILRRAVEANPKDVGVRLDLAQVMAQSGGAAQAKPLIDELAKQQPDNLPVLDTQFKIAIATGDLVTAKGAADAIAAKQPQSSVGYFYQGVVAEGGHRLEEAAKLYSSALDVQPDAAEPLRRLATVLVQLKRMPEALKRLDAVTQRYPQSVVASLIEGDLYLGAQQPKDAATVFRGVVTRDSQSVVGYGRLATAQVAARDDAAAIATLKDGIGKVADPEPLQLSLAALYDATRQPGEAARIYELMLQRNPRSDVAANNLAMLLVTQRSDQASLDRAAQLAGRFAQSTNPDFLDTYGWVLYKRGEAAAAVVALRSVIARVPESSVGLYHLGMAQVLAGQTDAARDNLSHALKSGKPFPGSDEARAELERLAGRTAVNAAPAKS
jgi:tetratricopeptide (TPR) repeat protein